MLHICTVFELFLMLSVVFEEFFLVEADLTGCEVPVSVIVLPDEVKTYGSISLME